MVEFGNQYRVRESMSLKQRLLQVNRIFKRYTVEIHIYLNYESRVSNSKSPHLQSKESGELRNGAFIQFASLER